MAQFPSAVKVFTTKNSGDTIQASHIDDLQDEVTALEDGLLNNAGTVNLSVASVSAATSTVVNGVISSLTATMARITTVLAGGSTNRTSTGGSLATSDGIAFPATHNPVGDSNTLDDYREGTFTPGMSFGGGVTGITYTTQQGSYAKVGRLVTFTARVILSNKGSATGNARVTGLPIQAAATYTSPVSIGPYGALVSQPKYAVVEAGGTAVLLYNGGSVASSNLQETDFNNNSDIAVGGSYLASS